MSTKMIKMRLVSIILFFCIIYNIFFVQNIEAQFLSHDPVAVDYTNPISLNEHQYCLNNPLVYVDPDGRDVVGVHGGFTGNWTGTEGMMWNYRNMLASTVFKDVPAISLNFQHSGFMQSNPNHA